ncbi:MAG: transcriptional regulator [Desulfobacterales bacterium CG23_combo_of_CG06-09_8_20_14_all_51_8]|nr:MAG: transcriptional regulator [Desulfobacterales bacterium CG23_combo_of_CG06-09_8_20_14_all_51_8]
MIQDENGITGSVFSDVTRFGEHYPPITCQSFRGMMKPIVDISDKHSEIENLQGPFWHKDILETFQTLNPVMKKVYDQIRSVAPTKTTVLLCGETGTGKGVLASLIHRLSHREKDQLVSVHCGAIPDTLLESELFGHEKGAFTGAFKRKLGKFEIAGKGTMFLDEISTITPSAQIKLLQVLQDGTFSRVGGEEIFHTDARFVAATNMDLKKMCDNGIFRYDLYYRLNVFPIEIPSLRDRREDIPLLVDTFIRKLNMTMQKRIQSARPDVLDAMQTYPWPGNIRELENLMERAFILESSYVLTPESFPAEFFAGAQKSAVFNVDTALTLAEARHIAVNEFERRFIKELLAKNRGRINKSSVEAGISTRQFHKLMIKHGIEKKDYKI